jgi:tetratricopeptide (TPR) repeat protein
MSANRVAWTLALLLAAAAGFPQGRQSDRTAAERYLDQARLQVSAGAWSQAAALLERSLEFFPEYSEACLLQARLALREQEGTRAGRDWLARALASGTWTVTDPRQASTELAAVLVRTRRFAEVRPVLASLSDGASGPGLGAWGNPDAALLWGRALLGLGDPSAASRHLELALARYPRDPRLYLELARARQALRQTAGALEVLSRGQRALPGSPELTLAAARVERDRLRRLELLEEYSRRGGNNPAAAALALSLRPRNPASWQEHFLAWGGTAAARPLADLLALYRTPPQPLLAAVQGYSGPRILDEDEDGFYEERYELQDGGLRGWVLDRDQDGIADVRVRFEAGLPQSLEAGGLEYRYSSYPWLDGITARDERGLRIYELPPYRERLVLFAGSPPFGSALLRLSSGRWPAEAAVARLASAMRETSTGLEGPERRYSLLGGQVVRLEEAPDSSGRYGRVVEYSRGQPAAGRRDLDRDGIFEVSESYAGGQLSGLSMDRDGDGRPEYWERYGPEGSRHFWDYDGDGQADSRELQSGDSLVREFTSRRDGVFDAAAVFRGGRLVEFRRGGRTLPVTPSSAAGLYWLGRPAGRPERFLGLPDGLHRIDSGSFFVFTYGDRRYVEQL